MSGEAEIQAQLLQKFPFLDGHVRVARERRLFAEAPAGKVGEVFAHAIGPMGFSILCTITGLDLGENLGVIYHLARPTGEVLNLSTAVPKAQPVLQTVSGTFPAADGYERELVDLLGFQVQGLPPGNRYPLPDGWPAGQFPLRKDWKAERLEGVFPPKEADHA
jgi:membrane-bound hydrogenase subunit beta